MTDLDNLSDQISLAKAEIALGDALRAFARAAKALPTYPDGQCCDEPDLYEREIGYERWTQIPDPTERPLHAYTNGWDDMGDSGVAAHLHCSACGGTWERPADIDYD